MSHERYPSVEQRLRLLALVQRIHALSPVSPSTDYDEYILSRLWAVADAVVNTNFGSLRTTSGLGPPVSALDKAEYYRAIAAMCLGNNAKEIYVFHPTQWDPAFPTFEAHVAASESAVDRWLLRRAEVLDGVR